VGHNFCTLSGNLTGRSTGGNTDEELCNRWMQLSAFTPFYRNHNLKGSIGQEPYRWDSVANASRTAIAARYSLLPYWVNEVPGVARALIY
jgi:alpha-glucosidase (family GH31 glycosyl hydrolase)